MEEFKKWLKQAEEDLKWAKSSVGSKIFYGACFAAQQSVEKNLKAFLIFHKKPLRKTHDVLTLLEDCIDIDKGFESLKLLVGVVAPYYVETRYPDLIEQADFDSKEAAKACDAAREIIEFVKSKL